MIKAPHSFSVAYGISSSLTAFNVTGRHQSHWTSLGNKHFVALGGAGFSKHAIYGREKKEASEATPHIVEKRKGASEATPHVGGQEGGIQQAAIFAREKGCSQQARPPYVVKKTQFKSDTRAKRSFMWSRDYDHVMFLGRLCGPHRRVS